MSLRIALAFPDKYDVGMSYLGHKILYEIINSRPFWQAERLFAPDLDAGQVLRDKNAPLCTLESDTPLGALDALGFSITHELCYTNVLYMLDLGGIPLRTAKRAMEPGRWPLVMAGGGCTMAGEPLSPFVDIMFLGEGEDMVIEALEIYAAYRDAGFHAATDRERMLRDLARVPGVYVPEFFAPGDDGALRSLVPDMARPGRRIVPDLDTGAYPVSQVIPFGAVHNRLALEIARGCTRGCRFCQAGMTYRPARERRVTTLTDLVDECLSGTGYGDLSFLSLSTGDFSALKTLFTACVTRCREEEISLSLPSLRVGSVDDAIMGGIADIRRTGATIAPEAGSQRLRNVINKGVTENDLICHVQKLFEHGWQQVKLYFMIGLPTETDEDILAIADLCRKARDAAGPGIKRLQITAAISPFVPKPHTPFQWESQISREEIHRRVGLLLNVFKKEKRITMRWHDPDTSFLEGIFSRGDRRLAPVLERAYHKGAIFASWKEHFALEPWLDAMREEGLTPEEYQRAIPLDAPLPWDHLENGVSREFLLRERDNAFAGKVVEDCRYGPCLACGACDTKAGLSRLPRRAETKRIANRLNLSRRDQDAHAPVLDEYGRVISRRTPEKTAVHEGGKKRPPAISEHLTHKAQHLRLWYERKGLAVYLSQLELQTLFERALRRAEVPLSFSQGFHPLPALSFCRALPVGVASEAEWLTIHLREFRDPTLLVRNLNVIVPGLIVTEAETLTVNHRPAESDSDIFHIACLGDTSRQANFSAAWERIAERDAIPWTRATKNGEKTCDARAFVREVLPGHSGGCILRFTWEAGYLSPLALVMALMEGVGIPVAAPEFVLTKLRAMPVQSAHNVAG